MPGKREVFTPALGDDRALYALLLTRHQTIVEVVVCAERVLVRAVAVWRADADVLPRTYAERDGVSRRNVEAFRVRERLRVRRVDDDADSLGARHRAEPFVRSGDQTYFLVLIQHPAAAEYRRRPAVLQPLSQHAVRLRGLGRREREAVIVVGVEELPKVALPIALLAAVATRHDELLERDAGARHQVTVDVRRYGGSREHRLEDLDIDVLHLEHRVVLGHDRHVGVDERVIGVFAPLQRVARLLEDTVQLVQYDRVQVPHVAQRDRGERDDERQHLDRHLLWERLVLAQQLTELDAEEAHRDEAHEHPENARCRRLGADQTRHAVHAGARGKSLQQGNQVPICTCKKRESICAYVNATRVGHYI